MTKLQKNQAGFTVLELVISIVAIVIIAGIVLLTIWK